jgi:hypothetical protein
MCQLLSLRETAIDAQKIHSFFMDFLCLEYSERNGFFMNYLATFHTHYGAMRFHKYCKSNNISSKMTPTPRELSSSCGVCVCFESVCDPSGNAHEDLENYYAITVNGKYSLMKG